MKNVMLLLPASRDALDFAIEAAKREGSALFALYVLDAGVSDEISEKFADMGFIGDKPSMKISEALTKEKRQQGYEQLGAIQIRCMEEGVNYEPLMEEGDIIEKTLENLERCGVGMLVVTKGKKKGFKSYFRTSPHDELKDRASCEVRLFEE